MHRTEHSGLKNDGGMIRGQQREIRLALSMRTGNGDDPIRFRAQQMPKNRQRVFVSHDDARPGWQWSQRVRRAVGIGAELS